MYLIEDCLEDQVHVPHSFYHDTILNQFKVQTSHPHKLYLALKLFHGRLQCPDQI